MLAVLLLPVEGRPGSGDLKAEAVLAARADLADDRGPVPAALEADQDGGRVLGADLDLLDRALRRREGHAAAHGPGASRQERGEVGEDRLDPPPGHELRRVEPVRADVRHGARGAARLGLEAPVVVGGVREPVLDVAAVNQAQLADLAGAR